MGKLIIEFAKVPIKAGQSDKLIASAKEAAKNNAFPLPSPLFIKEDKNKGMWYAVIDDADTDEWEKNIVGKIATVNGEKDLSPLEDVVNVNYEMKLIGISNSNVMTAELVSKSAVKKNTGKSDLDDEITKVLDKKIEEGIIDENYKQFIINTFEDNMIDKYTQLSIVKNYKECDSVVIPKHIYKNPTPGKPSVLQQILLLVMGKVPVIFKGDKSVGKNVAFDTVCALLHEPSYLMSISRFIDAEAFTGQYKLTNATADSLSLEGAKDYVSYSVTQDSKFLDNAAKYQYTKDRASVIEMVMDDAVFCSWLENGGCLMLNEWNLGDPNLLAMFLNPITDNTGYIIVPGRGRINVNPNCRLFACENENYSGTMEQNEATVSRFAAVEFPYPPTIKPQLRSIIEHDFKEGILKEKYYSECDAVYKDCQTAVHQGQLSNGVLNIRGFERALRVLAIANGQTTLADQLVLNVINTCPPDERLALREVIASKCSEKITI